jgi:hypothetical protein
MEDSTLDIALGNELIQEDERSLFRAHLSISDSYEYLQGLSDLTVLALKSHAPITFAREQVSSNRPPFAHASAENSLNDSDFGWLNETLAAQDERVLDDEENSGVGYKCLSPDLLGLIWVPHPYREWAMFRIAEVSYDIESGQLQFERLCPDKKVANLIQVTNEIFHAKSQSLVLDEAALLLKHPRHSLVGENKSLNSYQTGKNSG